MTEEMQSGAPARDSDILADYRACLRAEARQQVTNGLVLLGFSALLILTTHNRYPLFVLLLPTLGVISLIQAFFTRRRAREVVEADALVFLRMVAFDEQVRTAKLRHTWIILGGLVVMFLAQHKAGLDTSIELAGLVKDRVREGEWWRLLSCALLHANLLHIATNGASLVALGRLIETQGDPDDLPIVFTVATFTGSLASCVLMPSVPSVGASGGILGLSGYLLVLAFRRHGVLPPGLSRMLWRGVALTALVGVLGYHYIDNAAHLGGLIGGALTGLLLIRRTPHPASPLAATLKAMAAWACLGWFGGAAFFCIRSLLGV